MNGIFEALDKLKDRIDDKYDKIEDKFDDKFTKLNERIDTIVKHLSVYNQQLTKHIEGVKSIREENKLLKDYIDVEKKKLEKKFEEEVKPLAEYVGKEKTKMELAKDRMDMSMRWLGILSAIGGIVYTAIKIIENL